MKIDYNALMSGLDQLYLLPFLEHETPNDRAQAIDNYLRMSGWDWNNIIERLTKERG